MMTTTNSSKPAQKRGWMIVLGIFITGVFINAFVSISSLIEYVATHDESTYAASRFSGTVTIVFCVGSLASFILYVRTKS